MHIPVPQPRRGGQEDARILDYVSYTFPPELALMISAHESLPEIVHTKDGAAVLRELLVRGNAKASLLLRSVSLC